MSSVNTCSWLYRAILYLTQVSHSDEKTWNRCLFVMSELWFNHTGCLWDWDMDEWDVWFYVEPFTLYLNRHRGQNLLSTIVLVPVPVPVSVADKASVITALHWVPHTTRSVNTSTRLYFISRKRTLLTDMDVKGFWLQRVPLSRTDFYKLNYLLWALPSVSVVSELYWAPLRSVHSSVLTRNSDRNFYQ